MQQQAFARGIETKFGVSICIRGDLHVAIWRQPVNQENWRYYALTMDRAMNANPDGTVLAISIIDPRSSPPDMRQRALIQEDFKRWVRMRRFITGVVGDGIYARVVRAFVRTSLMTFRPGQQVFFEKTGDMIAQLKLFSTERTPSEREVIACIQFMQASLGDVVVFPVEK